MSNNITKSNSVSTMSSSDPLQIQNQAPNKHSNKKKSSDFTISELAVILLLGTAGAFMLSRSPRVPFEPVVTQVCFPGPVNPYNVESFQLFEQSRIWGQVYCICNTSGSVEWQNSDSGLVDLSGMDANPGSVKSENFISRITEMGQRIISGITLLIDRKGFRYVNEQDKFVDCSCAGRIENKEKKISEICFPI